MAALSVHECEELMGILRVGEKPDKRQEWRTAEEHIDELFWKEGITVR